MPLDIRQMRLREVKILFEVHTEFQFIHEQLLLEPMQSLDHNFFVVMAKALYPRHLLWL